jgi:hypothetical protein
MYSYHGGPSAAALARYDEKEELAVLKDRARHFSLILDDINKRVDELRKATEGDREHERIHLPEMRRVSRVMMVTIV